MITSSSNAQVKKHYCAEQKKQKNAGSRTFSWRRAGKCSRKRRGNGLKKVYVSESGSKMHEIPSDGTEYEVVDGPRVQFHVRHEDAAGCFSVIRMPPLHRRGGDGQRKDTASDGT